MNNSSYLLLDQEHAEYAIPTDIVQSDFMKARDISWIAQVRPFIKHFCKKGDTIIDPFAGLGTTLIAAGLNEVNSIGLEIEPDRFDLLNKRLKGLSKLFDTQPITFNANAITYTYPTLVDAIITNPPYFHNKPTTDSDNNIYNIENYETYLNLIELVLRKAEKSLKKQGYLILFSENIRTPNGNMIPQAYDICRIIQKYFNLKEERLVLYPKEEKQSINLTKTNRSHEYVFIATKKIKKVMVQPYLDFLHQLSDQRISYTTIGTFAVNMGPLKYSLDNPPADLDILIPFEEVPITKTVNLLQKEGYDIKVWEKPLSTPVQFSNLVGKYYFRATKVINNTNYQIDVTFESDILNVSECINQSYEIKGIKIATTDYIKKMLSAQNTTKSLTLLENIEELENHG